MFSPNEVAIIPLEVHRKDFSPKSVRRNHRRHTAVLWSDFHIVDSCVVLLACRVPIVESFFGSLRTHFRKTGTERHPWSGNRNTVYGMFN